MNNIMPWLIAVVMIAAFVYGKVYAHYVHNIPTAVICDDTKCVSIPKRLEDV